MPSRRQERQQMLKKEGEKNSPEVTEDKVLGLGLEESAATAANSEEAEVEANPVEDNKENKTEENKETQKDEEIKSEPLSEIKPKDKKTTKTEKETIPVVETKTVASFGTTQKPAAQAYSTSGEEQKNLQKEWLSFLSFLGTSEARRILTGKNWQHKLRQAIGNVEF